MTNNRYHFDRNDDRENRSAQDERGFDVREQYVDIYSDEYSGRTRNVRRNDCASRDDAYRRTDRERRAAAGSKSGTTGIVLSAIAVAMAAVIAASALAIGAFTVKPVGGNTDPTLSIAASVDKDAGKSAQNTSQAAEQIAAKTNDSQSEDRIDTVNGERIYIDTKRPAPDNSGTPAHFYANGKTSYGFDWTYDADNDNFVIRCDYNFNEQQYDFQFYGTAPGTAHITVYYNTDDNTQVPVNLTLNVDDSLNADIA